MARPHPLRRALFCVAPALLICLLLAACDAPGDAIDVLVNSTADGHDAVPGNGVCEMTVGVGNCSLRAAIDEANAYAVHPLEIHIPAGNHPLTLAGDNENANGTGDLDIMPANPAGLWITGDAAGAIIDGNGLDRVIDHRAGNLTIYNFTITGGDENTPQITDETGGGGIRSAGSNADLKLIAVIVEGNTSASLGGGVVLDHAGLTSSVTIMLSSIRENHARFGGGIANHGTEFVLAQSTVTQNTASQWGGGVFVDADTSILKTTVSQNEAPIGGGIFDFSGPFTVRDSSITSNTATGASSQGGGLLMLDEVTIERSSITGNHAVDGGGIDASDAGNLWILSSTISGNVATHDGGGIHGFASLSTSTVTGNSAGHEAGGVEEADLESSTVVGNTAPVAADLRSATALGSILGTCDPGSFLTESLGYNINQDDSCDLTEPTDITGLDPLLGPLANNGGPTLTRLPGAGSPARNAIPAGTPGICNGDPATDQRGIARPQGGACDIGAVEQ